MSKAPSKAAAPISKGRWEIPPAIAPFLMDRAVAIPALIGDHKDFLFVTGLAGSSRDIAHLTNDGGNLFTMAGTMGAAVSMGLGLALARPDKKVLCVTGDGELLMNVGALATVAVMNPANFGIICVDNGHYGETGYQKSHTSLGVDLEKMAVGAGIKSTCTIQQPGEIKSGARMLRESNGACFVLLKVKPGEPPAFKRDLHAGAARVRFRMGLLGQG
jgi:thiamine pyrophosphate-dependent acetolactate synthase large subunit-like protein